MASYDFDAQTGRYNIRFRWGKAFNRPLKLAGETEARAVVARVHETIDALKRGWLTLPDGADAGAFILSGGRVTGKPTRSDTQSDPPGPPTLGQLWELYDERSAERSKESTTRATEGYHREHLLRHLGPDLPLEAIDLELIQGYARSRSREQWRGKQIGSATILKEVATLRVVWNWGRRFKKLSSPFPLRLGDLEFERRGDRAPFQTREQIERTIARGGLSEEEQSTLWECLYLTLRDVHEVLEHVRNNAMHPFIHPMFVLAAMTGARRSEICRARIDDFDFENLAVTIREKKRKQGRDSFRKVDINSQLLGVMRECFATHPGGQHAISKDGQPLTVKMATDHFKRVLSRSKWSVIPGFHTFRHSFASILASKGVDEPTIDKWMGHQTPEQRERYRHLFPQGLKRSIELLADAAPGS